MKFNVLKSNGIPPSRNAPFFKCTRKEIPPTKNGFYNKMIFIKKFHNINLRNDFTKQLIQSMIGLLSQ